MARRWDPSWIPSGGIFNDDQEIPQVHPQAAYHGHLQGMEERCTEELGEDKCSDNPIDDENTMTDGRGAMLDVLHDEHVWTPSDTAGDEAAAGDLADIVMMAATR